MAKSEASVSVKVRGEIMFAALVQIARVLPEVVALRLTRAACRMISIRVYVDGSRVKVLHLSDYVEIKLAPKHHDDEPSV